MAYAVAVMVVDKRSRQGLAGQRVKCYGGPELKTDASGRATVVSDSSNTTVYVNGFEVYSGAVSRAPNPIVYEKG